MNARHRVLFSLFAAALLIGCAPVVAPTASDRATEPEGCFTALIEGTLVADDRRLDIQSRYDGAVVVVRWPDRYAVRPDGGRLTVFDGKGRPLGREGDHVRLGGGESDGAWVACESTGVEVLSAR